MEKQYAGPITVRALLDKLKNLFAAKESVDELSAGVAYINATDNETITDVNTSPSGPASIDVTAEVGQTIIVKEVDANGKPTKWESADYQPRTHWTDVVEILPETTAEVDAEMGAAILPEFTLTDGAEYVVNYNGTEFTRVCFGGFAIGNLGAVDETITDTGEPFIIIIDGEVESPVYVCVPLDGSTSVTLSIAQVEHTPIPIQYVTNAFPYYIDVTGSGTDVDPYVCNDTVANVEAIYKSGRAIAVKYRENIPGGEGSVLGYTETISSLLSAASNLSENPNGIILAFFSGGMMNAATSLAQLFIFSPKEDGTYFVTNLLGD